MAKPKHFDFEKDLKKANKIEDLDERILFLEKRKKEYLQDQGGIGDFEGIAKKYQREIDYLYKEKKIRQQGKPGKAIQPIWWKESGRLLKYLLDELARLDYIDRKSPVNKHIKQLFINRERESFTDSIKQNSSATGANKGTDKNQKTKPKGHKEIDNLINSLKSLKDQEGQ